jgi:hypothetical protein
MKSAKIIMSIMRHHAPGMQSTESGYALYMISTCMHACTLRVCVLCAGLHAWTLWVYVQAACLCTLSVYAGVHACTLCQAECAYILVFVSVRIIKRHHHHPLMQVCACTLWVYVQTSSSSSYAGLCMYTLSICTDCMLVYSEPCATPGMQACMHVHSACAFMIICTGCMLVYSECGYLHWPLVYVCELACRRIMYKAWKREGDVQAMQERSTCTRHHARGMQERGRNCVCACVRVACVCVCVCVHARTPLLNNNEEYKYNNK